MIKEDLMCYLPGMIERNNDINLVESGASDDFKVRIGFQVWVINKLKLLALGEEDKSSKSRENCIYLWYCSIVINTSVGAIAKVNGVFVFHLNKSKKLWWLIF